MSKKVIVAVIISVVALIGLFFILQPTPETPARNQESQTQNTTGQPEQPPAEAEPRVYSINISETSEPETIEVTQGEEITVKLTSQSPEEVHLHGYDISADVNPGQPTEVTFTADTAGQFALESHDSGAELATIIVRPE